VLLAKRSFTVANESSCRIYLFYVASAEDVVVAKLEWSKLAQSQRHIEDVAGIWRVRWESLDRAYLAKWIVELGLEKEWNDAQHAAGIRS
jgi:hypothetical protein